MLQNDKYFHFNLWISFLYFLVHCIFICHCVWLISSKFSCWVIKLFLGYRDLLSPLMKSFVFIDVLETLNKRQSTQVWWLENPWDLMTIFFPSLDLQIAGLQHWTIRHDSQFSNYSFIMTVHSYYLLLSSDAE